MLNYHILSQRLTRDIGIPLAELPLEPQHGRILLASSSCGEEAVTLVSLLSVPHLWTASRGAHRAQVCEDRVQGIAMVSMVEFYHCTQDLDIIDVLDQPQQYVYLCDESFCKHAN